MEWPLTHGWYGGGSRTLLYVHAEGEHAGLHGRRPHVDHAPATAGHLLTGQAADVGELMGTEQEAQVLGS